MLIKPKFRGFICTTSHPEGCKKEVINQINYVKNKPKFKGPKKVLVIGSSTGYGLASRIVNTYGAGADTVGVFFERPCQKNRPATAGWYNTAAFEEMAKKDGYGAYSINGDAFSHEIKNKTMELIKDKLGKVDMVVYSLAAPKRKDPDTNEVYSSVLKPIDHEYSSKTVDFHSEKVLEVNIEPAQEGEIEGTVSVMGGSDWRLWIEALKKEDLLSEGACTVAYSYVGPQLTYPIYRNGTVGRAKDHLEEMAGSLTEILSDIKGKAYVSVNKALVTQSSSAIPVVPLYMAILFKLMKEKNIHEGCIEQMYKLFNDRLYSNLPIKTDEKNRIRIDDLEMREDIQSSIEEIWQKVDTENVSSLSDIKGYREDFFKLFGFNVDGVNYELEVEPDIKIPSIEVEVTN